MGRILALGGRARYIASVYQKIDVLWVPNSKSVFRQSFLLAGASYGFAP